MSKQQLRQIIAKKVVGQKCQDEKGRQGFNLKGNYILHLKEQQKNKCAECGVEMLWDFVPFTNRATLY